MKSVRQQHRSRPFIRTALVVAMTAALGTATSTAAIAGSEKADEAHNAYPATHEDKMADNRMDKDDDWANDWQGEANDAWIDGRIESAYALNRYLNPLDIDTDVERNVVTLTGTVNSPVDKELAAEIASGIEGVEKVDNRLDVREQDDDTMETSNAFASFIEDATITARVKYALIESGNIEGFDIDVDTNRQTVMLSGNVDTEQARELAGEIARNTEGVVNVENELRVERTS